MAAKKSTKTPKDKKAADTGPKAGDRADTASKTVSAADLRAVDSRLDEAVYEMLAVHRIAIVAQDANPPERDFDLKAIERLARSAVRGVQACQHRLGNTAAGPDFETEFD